MVEAIEITCVAYHILGVQSASVVITKSVELTNASLLGRSPCKSFAVKNDATKRLKNVLLI